MPATPPTRVALVTGAGQRVGRAIAEALGVAGWGVAAHYHASRKGAEEVVRAVREAGGRAASFAADLSAPTGQRELIDAVVAEFGRLDLLVNSAAGMTATPFGDVTAAQFDAIVALNLRGPFLMTQAAARVMHEGAVVVNIADHMADEPWPDYSVHGITKAGVASMTRHLAAALAPRIRVNAVAPGFVLAPPGSDPELAASFARDTPLARIGTPADVAAAVRYLAEAEYVTGETLYVDGGRRVRR